MKHASLLPMCALAVAACADVQDPVMPKVSSLDRAVAVGAPTTIVYSNFGPEMTFDAGPFHGWTVNGFVGPGVGQQALSQRFTPAGDYTLTTASVALTHFSGPTRIRVILQADSLGLPGPILEEMSLEPVSSTTSVYSVTSVLSPALNNAIAYWLTIAAGSNGVLAGWNWNSIGDVASMNFAVTQFGGPGGPWGLPNGLTRGAFQIDGRKVPARGALEHEASGGGTVIWSNGSKVTYGINARQMSDGSVKGELLFHLHDNVTHYKGTVTCLTVIGNRAYLSGDLTQAKPPFNYAHFAIGLEDNGEGINAAAADRISGLILLPHGWPSCFQSFPVTDWTHGNAQVR